MPQSCEPPALNPGPEATDAVPFTSAAPAHTPQPGPGAPPPPQPAPALVPLEPLRPDPPPPAPSGPAHMLQPGHAPPCVRHKSPARSPGPGICRGPAGRPVPSSSGAPHFECGPRHEGAAAVLDRHPPLSPSPTSRTVPSAAIGPGEAPSAVPCHRGNAEPAQAEAPQHAAESTPALPPQQPQQPEAPRHDLDPLSVHPASPASGRCCPSPAAHPLQPPVLAGGS